MSYKTNQVERQLMCGNPFCFYGSDRFEISSNKKYCAYCGQKLEEFDREK